MRLGVACKHTRLAPDTSAGSNLDSDASFCHSRDVSSILMQLRLRIWKHNTCRISKAQIFSESNLELTC